MIRAFTKYFYTSVKNKTNSFISKIKDTDNQYKTLIEEYHENTSVLASRMEAQIQALEGLVRSERKNLIEAYKNQKSDHLKRNDRSWQVKSEAINRTANEQMEAR